MSIKTITLGVALVASTAFITHSLTSQDGDAPKFANKMEEMMAAMAAGMPGEHHKALAQTAGEWDIASSYWMDPSMPAEKAPAKSEIKMILGGRYMFETFTMDSMGGPFEGNLIMGYNNITKEYESIWIDNMSSGMSYTSGTSDGHGNYEMKGTKVDVRTPKGRPFRMTTAQNEDGTVTFKMFDTDHDGKEMLIMENVYTRS